MWLKFNSVNKTYIHDRDREQIKCWLKEMKTMGLWFSWVHESTESSQDASPSHFQGLSSVSLRKSLGKQHACQFRYYQKNRSVSCSVI